MSVYDYIIVGGGISGLFTAYKLSETGKSILLVESTNRWGGRIYTKVEKGVQFDLGAGRIANTHTKVMSLLNDLNLKDDLIELPDKINYKIQGPKINFYSYVTKVLEGSKVYSKKYLQTINLLQLCIDILGQKQSKLLQAKLGYDSEFLSLNAYSGIKSLKKDLFSSTKYFILKKGLSSITDTLVNRLQVKENITMKLDTNVTDIGKNYIQINKKKIHGLRIVCCVPYLSLKEYPKFKEVDGLDSVEPIPLLRIYAVYPKDKSGKVWFHNLPRTITDNYIRHIIPIDYEKGLIMISYTDGLYATMWQNLTKLGNKVLVDHLHKEVKQVLGKSPPKPTFITSYYWNAGVHMWKPGYDMNEIHKKMLQPFDKEKVYIANECYSKHQSWIEGCLDTCYDVLELMSSDFKRSLPKKGGGKPKRRSKLYTIQEVLKKRNWIVMDIKGKLRIYDVGKWLKDHPGGSENLKRGIKANKHYKDPKKYPESPIQLFKQIGAHSSGRVLKSMLIDMKNPKVKYIGLMKKV